MHVVSDNAVSQQSLAAPSVGIYPAGETILSTSSNNGRLLNLKKSAVPVDKERDQHSQLSCITRKTIDKIEELLGASGGNLVYAGYPYDPFVLDTVKC